MHANVSRKGLLINKIMERRNRKYHWSGSLNKFKGIQSYNNYHQIEIRTCERNQIKKMMNEPSRRTTHAGSRSDNFC